MRHEHLEIRSMLSVNTLSGFDGLDYGDTNTDRAVTTLAVSDDHVAQIAGHELAIYDRTDNAKVFQEDLDTFFAGEMESSQNFAGVGYDSDLERFVVFSADNDGLLYAISDAADPTADPDNDGSSFSEKVKVDLPAGLFAGEKRFVWNADAQVISMATYADSGRTDYENTTLFIIDKSSLIDASPGISTTTLGLPDHLRFAVPAVMHGADPGDSLWLVGRSADSNPTQVSVIEVSNLLTTMDVADYDMMDAAVFGYDNAEQPGQQDIKLFGPAFRSAQWRDGRLVTAAHGQSLSDLNESDVFWYEFDTTGAAPAITQTGVIDPGQGVWAYYPTIAIGTDGELGLTYMQSSNSEYMSMYVTGQTTDDPLGQMQTPVVAQAGVASISYGKFVSAPYEVANSSISVDADNGSFWAAGEYADQITKGGKKPNWATWVSNFTVGDSAPPPPNTDPVAIGDSYGTDEDTVLDLGAPGVLANDTDTDGDTLTVLSFDSTSTHGAVVSVSSDGSITYDPRSASALQNLSTGATLEDSFNYTIGDGRGGVASAIVTVTVSGLDETPPPPTEDVALYVSKITFDSRRRGRDHQAVFQIRSDSDGDGVASAGDSLTAGVSITVTFANRTFSGVTDANGVFRTSWVKNIGGGEHYANTVDLALEGFAWNPLGLDTEDDSDGDGLPDALLSIN